MWIHTLVYTYRKLRHKYQKIWYSSISARHHSNAIATHGHRVERQKANRLPLKLHVSSRFCGFYFPFQFNSFFGLIFSGFVWSNATLSISLDAHCTSTLRMESLMWPWDIVWHVFNLTLICKWMLEIWRSIWENQLMKKSALVHRN